MSLPYRIDLAGGWLDQPFISKIHPGPVIGISIEPLTEFNTRGGMATSTRNKAKEVWRDNIPNGNSEKLAKMLFCYENPPGTDEFSGSQDAINMIMPGLKKLYYNNNYWPDYILSCNSEPILKWLEERLYLISVGSRKNGYNVFENKNISAHHVYNLSISSNACWESILNKDVLNFGKYMTESFNHQVAMFPNMINDEIKSIIDKYKNKALGWKISGAGGGGYVIFVSETPIENAIQIKIRRI